MLAIKKKENLKQKKLTYLAWPTVNDHTLPKVL